MDSEEDLSGTEAQTSMRLMSGSVYPIIANYLLAFEKRLSSDIVSMWMENVFTFKLL